MNNKIEQVYMEIVAFAIKTGATKVILFGSRARGDHRSKSDIDIAVYGCTDFMQLKEKIDEELWSLLQVDLINMESEYLSKDLIEEINKDGVILYEKV